MNDLEDLIKQARYDLDVAQEELRKGLDKHASGEISAKELGELIETARQARLNEMTLVGQWVYVRNPELTDIEDEENDE